MQEKLTRIIAGLPSGWTMQVAPNGRVFFINHLDKKVDYIDGLVFDIAHFRPPGLILETVVPPPFLVRAMFPTGSPIFLHISTNCQNDFSDGTRMTSVPCPRVGRSGFTQTEGYFSLITTQGNFKQFV